MTERLFTEDSGRLLKEDGDAILCEFQYVAFQRNAFQNDAFPTIGVLNAKGTMAGAGTATLIPSVDREVAGTMAGAGTITLAPSIFVSLTLAGAGTATVSVTIYGKHAYWQKSSRFTIVSPNKITVRTRPEEGGTAYTGSATEPVSYAKLPKEDFIYASLASDAEAANIAAAKIDRLSRNSQTGSGLVPMNVGQEVLDWILFTDRWGNDADRGRVKSITRHAAANTFTMGVSFASRVPELPFGQLELLLFESPIQEPVPQWVTILKEYIDKQDKVLGEHHNALVDKHNELLDAFISFASSPCIIFDNTPVRAIDGTVYRNNSSGRTRLVAVNVQCAVAGTSGSSMVTAICDGSNPPITQMQVVGGTTSVSGEGVGIVDSKDYVMVFAVPRRFYYKLSSSTTGDGIAPQLLDWFEFDQI